MKPVLPPSTRILPEGMRPEGRLILSCTRVELDLTTAEHIRTLTQQELDWSYVLQMAEKHRVMPLIYRALNSTCPEAVPPQTLNDLRHRFFANVRHNLLLTNELFRLLHQFQAHDIRVIPYKGTVLAAIAYGKLALRQVWDLDFLVHEHDFPKSRALLLADGYQIRESFDREQSFAHPDRVIDERPIEVDLHWGLTPFYFPFTVDFDHLWQNVQSISITNTPVQTFAVEDLLLILCIQVAKDCWERQQHLEHLAKVCDIASVLRVNPNMDWGSITQQARLSGTERILHFGLLLANHLLNAPLPQPIEQTVQRDAIACSLAQQVCAALFQPADETFALRNSLFDLKLRMQQLLFYLKLRERPEDQIQYVLETLRTLFRVAAGALKSRSPMKDHLSWQKT